MYSAKLQGRVAVITGGASGIGEATARKFAEHGAKVIIADIQDTKGQKLASDLGGPDVARYIHCDVSQEEHVAAAVDFSISAYGGLDVMYNNAGAIGQMSSIDNTSMERFVREFGILLKGPMMGVKHAARVMKPLTKGSIITTASVAGHIGGAAPHSYTTLKHALLGLTRSAAFELRDYNIRVNSIAPGYISTSLWGDLPPDHVDNVLGLEMFSPQKSGLANALTGPQSIADAALFLASDDSSFVSGHSLVVDGGHAVIPSAPFSKAFFN
ncbi:hypothetical protein Mapa_007149 [Marchantia paleacea]|nr:hypothetical protein Mapa_007149 [Marchantia paleacea]